MAVVLAALMVSFAFAADAEWPRLVITPKQTIVDAPGAQPLRYFTKYPRDESGDFCFRCNAAERLARARAEKARANVKVVGRIGRFKIYDIFYYFGDEQTPAWKSIVIGTSPTAYQEIYHDQPLEGQPNPSFLVHAGDLPLLCVADNFYKLGVEEDCFWFDSGGVKRIDFAPILRAAQEAAPEGRTVWIHRLKAKRTFENMTLSLGILTQEWKQCCDRGIVNVRFKLDHGRVIVINTAFDPNADYDWQFTPQFDE